MTTRKVASNVWIRLQQGNWLQFVGAPCGLRTLYPLYSCFVVVLRSFSQNFPLGAPENEICPEMHALAKMAEMAINRQNRQTMSRNARIGENGRNGN